jgi:hypothetical protein
MQVKATLSLYQSLLLVCTHAPRLRLLAVINFRVKLFNKSIIKTIHLPNNLSPASYYHTVAPVVDSATNMHKLPTYITSSFCFR